MGGQCFPEENQDVIAKGRDHVVHLLSQNERTKVLAGDDEFVSRIMHIAEEPGLFCTNDLLESRIATALEVLNGPIDEFKAASNNGKKEEGNDWKIGR